ncbi:MAG TPA: hypothetical protein VEU07_10280 [Candidatus Acidoferrum sp.]|nr:hypothetical protein [Candidatus Acidoferrum sp.]
MISRLECAIAGQSGAVRFMPGSLSARAYGREEASEEFRCNFGLNPKYRSAFASEPLRVAGVDANGELRVVELANHRFFVATLFLPQLSSTPTFPHPLVLAYLRAGAAFRDARRARPQSERPDTIMVQGEDR